MIKRLALQVFSTKRTRAFLALMTMAALLAVALPLSPTRAQSGCNPAINKLSSALQQALTSNDLQVWADPSHQTVRTLIQTDGRGSVALTLAILLSGGVVIH